MNEASIQLEVRIDEEKKGFCEYICMNIFFKWSFFLIRSKIILREKVCVCLCERENKRKRVLGRKTTIYSTIHLVPLSVSWYQTNQQKQPQN